jgi:putative transcriptional regulator
MNKRTDKSKSRATLMDSIESAITDFEDVSDITATMRNLNALKYEEPIDYDAEQIVNLRKNKLKMSQSVFASLCNIKLPTLQKWERGYSRPTPPVKRLFQLVEKGALNLIVKK